MSAHPAEAVRAVLEATPKLLAHLVTSIPAHAFERPLDEGWSVKDVVAHLADAELIAFAERIGRIAESDRPFIRSIDPPARLATGRYRDRSLEDLLGEFTFRRARNLELVNRLSAEDLMRVGEHDEAGEITIYNVVHQWAYHDLMHLKQIASMLQTSLIEGMGNTRRFYDL